MSRGWKIALGVAAAVVLVNLALRELDRATRSPGGPASSSFATAPEGVAAYAELLERFDRPVIRLRETPADAELDPAATLVVLEPVGLTTDDGRAVQRFLAAGGRLVWGGPPSGWLESVAPGAAPEWRGDAETTVRGPFGGDARSVRTAGEGAWVERSAGGSLLVRERVGAGRALLLADPSPLQNRLLGQADNAALGLELAGERPVLFAESVHGYGAASGIDAIPGRWLWVFAGLLLAALTLALARGRRLGPPERETRRLPPARAEFAEAIATLLAKSRPRSTGVDAARAAVRRQLRIAPEAAEPELRAAAAERGAGPAELAALTAGDSERELLLLGGLLRRLERDERMRA